MKSKTQKKGLEVVSRGGNPAAVILDIEEYREMLERLEDMEDLKMLDEMRKRPLKFKKLETFLEEYHPGA